GEQLIDGSKAEQLLRFRHNDDGTTYPSSYGQQDLGRMRTQREFIIATLKQTLKPQNIFKLKQIIDIMAEDVNTNMDISKLKSYVPYAVKFNAENIRTGVVPGDVEMCNGVSLYIANSKKTEEMVADLFKTADEDSNEQTNTENTNTLSK
ncbi:MAG: LCP family protein, partial [Clostridia bacterium]